MLLGRSFTCPSEASTVKPFPKYFWMVFAFAGDSTMTNPFTNFLSVLDFLFPKLARMGQPQQVTAKQLSALSRQLSAFYQRCQHAFHFYGLVRKSLILWGFHELQIARQEQVILQFASRTRGHLQETSKIHVPSSTRTLRDVRADRNRRPPHLSGHSVHLIPRKCLAGLVNCKRQSVSLFSYRQIPKILHADSLTTGQAES